MLTVLGTGLTASEIEMYNESTWYSFKKWKSYSLNFNGNGYTGGTIASALKISESLKWIGRGLGANNAWSTYDQYRNKEINGFTALMEESSNAYLTL